MSVPEPESDLIRRSEELSAQIQVDFQRLSVTAIRVKREHDELARVLRFYVDAFPAFRHMPLGAPGSLERQALETHLDWEDRARALLESL